jgi:putative membrane protein
MRRGFLVAIFVFAGLLCGCENANENTVTTNTNANATLTNTNAVAQSTPARGVAPKHDDNAFVTNVAMDGMAEVELGRLAAQKAKNPDVKRFAQRMVTDHSKANAELKQLASKLGITIPAAATDAQKAEHDRLAKLSGAEFDREYMSLMTAGHDKAVSAFEDEAANGSVTDIKQWSAKILPTLKEHQALAKDIAAKLG